MKKRLLRPRRQPMANSNDREMAERDARISGLPWEGKNGILTANRLRSGVARTTRGGGKVIAEPVGRQH